MFGQSVLKDASFCVKMEVMRIVVSNFYAVSISRNWKWMKETKRETPAMSPAPVPGRSCRPADSCQLLVMTSTKCKLEASLDGFYLLWYVSYIKYRIRSSSPSFLPFLPHPILSTSRLLPAALHNLLFTILPWSR